MILTRFAIFIAVVGLVFALACQAGSSAIDSPAPNSAATKIIEATQAAATETTGATKAAPVRSTVAVPTTEPQPTNVGSAASSPVPRPEVADSPPPTITPEPSAVTESCTSSYSGSIISGPSEPARPHDNDSVFRSLTVHPTNPDIVALGTERNGFLWSYDGGETWTRYRKGLVPKDWGYSEVWDMDFAPSNPQLVMAATLGSPGPASGSEVAEGLYRSTDGGESWMLMNCGFSTSRSVSVRFDPLNPDVVVVGLEGGLPSYTGDNRYYEGGIFRTEDGGENWQKVVVAPDDGRNGYWLLRVVETSPAEIITFGMNYNDLSENLGFMRGTDMGSSWELFAPELRNKFIDNFDVSADGQSIYVSVRDEYSGWYSKDGGVTWSESQAVQVNGPIAVSPSDANLVVFSSFSHLSRSTDGFKTSQSVLSTPNTIREIVFSRSHPNMVYAEADGYILYRSDDAGLTWRQLINGRDDVLTVQP
ncbi:MAG: hypothetical protein HQ475_12755 [SAR202 cluster bacterium]|nr:hypothetical protein [SAR202 cluster bacterium]